MNKVAVIGLGSIATRHRFNLKSMYPSAELFSMSSSGRVPKENITNSDTLVTNIAVLIDSKVDFVVVASPSTCHAHHAIPLIEAGIPVLIEKPISSSVEDANAIMEAIERYGTPVAVGYCLRYLPSAVILKKSLEQSLIGTLYNAHIEVGQYLPDWRPGTDYRDSVSANPKLGGGALLELSHELDYTQWLLGTLTMKCAVLRSSDKLDLKVEDIADIIAITSSGVVTTIHLDFLQRKAHRKCSFIGSEGRIDWDLQRNTLTLTAEKEVSVLYTDPHWDKNQMYTQMISDFINSIGDKSITTEAVASAISIVELIDTIKNKKD